MPIVGHFVGRQLTFRARLRTSLIYIVAALSASALTVESWIPVNAGFRLPKERQAVCRFHVSLLTDRTLYASVHLSISPAYDPGHCAASCDDWERLGDGLRGDVWAFTIATTGTVYAAGKFSIGTAGRGFVRRWDAFRGPLRGMIPAGRPFAACRRFRRPPLCRRQVQRAWRR